MGQIIQPSTAFICVTLLLSGCDSAKVTNVTAYIPIDIELPIPTTVAEAVQVLDLMTFPVMECPKDRVTRRANSLSYTLEPEVHFTEILQFQRDAFRDRDWIELPESSLGDKYADSTFTRNGQFASASIMRIKGFYWWISITLHGNIDVRGLPIPAGLNPQTTGSPSRPESTAYETDESVISTSEAYRLLLKEHGWQPYEVIEYDPTVSSVRSFKQNGVLLVVDVCLAWPSDQKGKTRVDIHARLTPVELPIPDGTVRLRYYELTVRLSSLGQPANLYFESEKNEEELLAFYRETLRKAGWEATIDDAVKVGIASVMEFSNASNDLLTLRMWYFKPHKELRVTLFHQTKAERDALAELDSDSVKTE